MREGIIAYKVGGGDTRLLEYLPPLQSSQPLLGIVHFREARIGVFLPDEY
jgi:hypothetical protein